MMKDIEERSLRLQMEEKLSEGGNGNAEEKQEGPTKQEVLKENDKTKTSGEDKVAPGKRWNRKLR